MTNSSSSTSLQRTLSSPVLGMMWFGAAVSLAEILTGTFFAPLGLERGLLAIIVGHAIGAVLFGLVCYISAATGKSAMEAVRISFGRYGSVAFSLANVVQLIGWTAIMIASGAAAANYLVPACGYVAWCIIIGAFIVIWIAIGLQYMSRVQMVASIALLILTFVISSVVFGNPSLSVPIEQSLSFGAAVELAVAMPLSWLPVAGDYLRNARHATRATFASTFLYFIGSCWMYAIGLGLGLYAGSSDIAVVLAASGLGVVGILVVVFSTVTTTFLDAQSAGVSASAITEKIDARVAGIVAAAMGIILAAVAPVSSFEEFLYLIGSVFAPMATILCVDWFVLKNDASTRSINGINALLWLGGFILYRISLNWDIPCGNTVLVMVVIAVVSFGVHALVRVLAPQWEYRSSIQRNAPRA